MPEIKIVLPKFYCPKDIQPHLEKVLQGEYEVRLPGRAHRIIDLGANCGAFSVWASHRWPGSSVWAYEPHPENFKYLEQNLTDYSNVTAHNYAIGDPGWRILGDGLFNGGEASLYVVENNPLPVGRHVEVRSPLELPEADILKLDIEGAEVEVLPALLRAGRSFKAIMFEYHSDTIRRELDSLLSDYRLVGAEAYSVVERGVLRYLHRSVTI